MTRTTPPRPVDIAAVFPELAPLARTATRLHPRPGSPTPEDSSIGGPLRWPVDEPWPYCTEPHDPDSQSLMSPADVRLVRHTLTVAKRRETGGGGWLTTEERTLLERLQAGRPWTEAPVAMLPVAQLYARDVPGLGGPEGTDLLQVLWCPFNHLEGYMPTAKLFWRDSRTVATVLTEPPPPAAVEYDGYVPEPCVVHPEQVTEYPAPLELDEPLRERIEAWGEREKSGAAPGSAYDGAEGAFYQYELSVAPGWKVGGWAPWSFCDPWPRVCQCGCPMRPLLYIDSGEWDEESNWIPVEDLADATDPPDPSRPPWYPTAVIIGRGYGLQIYVCTDSPSHPHFEWMQ